MVAGMMIIAAAFQAATAVESRHGLRFSCRMVAASSAAFTIEGWIGEGRRFNLLSEGSRPLWGYRFDGGHINDSLMGFSGRPDEASTLPIGRDLRDFGLRIVYALASDGRSLVLQRGLEGDQPAVLVGDMFGEELATGVCAMRPNDDRGRRAGEER